MTVIRLTAVLAAALLLGACSSALERLDALDKGPELKPIANPVAEPGYQPVSMPMPYPRRTEHAANSLWRAGKRTFFRDQRAQDVGDILTVLINIDDKANVANSTLRTRDNKEGAALGAFLGFEASLDKVLPNAVDNTDLVDANSNSKSQGTGTIAREESIELRVAAIVTQVLPNGNLVIRGSQEVRVNYEVRELSIDGVVRREDISSDNTVSHDQVAEARILYGGRGTLSDVQRPRYGQELFDIFYPF